jgi:hypothetical protein
MNIKSDKKTIFLQQISSNLLAKKVKKQFDQDFSLSKNGIVFTPPPTKKKRIEKQLQNKTKKKK